LESAEECVTTHLPKWAAPKKDDAKASVHCPNPYHAAAAAQCPQTRLYTGWVRSE